jgi:hypothetical protein
MHVENLRKFMETRARAPRALYELILPRSRIQYDDYTYVQNGRQNGRNVSGITKNGAGYPVLLGARVREYASQSTWDQQRGGYRSQLLWL